MEEANSEKLHSFPYAATVAGVEHQFRITENDDRYGIEQDGLIIAEIAHGDVWRQLSGKPLSPELLESICNHIESHYD